MFWKKKEAVSAKWRWFLVAAFAVTLVLNGLAGSTTVLGGVNTAYVSDSNANLFAPAGTTFAIWGVIYTLLIGFCAYVFGLGRDKKSPLKDAMLLKVTQLFTVNVLLNGAWILAWQYQVLWLSVLLMVGILTTLVMIANILRKVNLRGGEYVLAKLPFSVYFGWITVATIANVTTWLVSVNWDGFGVRDGVWTVVMLLVGAGIGIATAYRNVDWAYLTVFVWAFTGILVKHLSPGGFDGHFPSVIAALTIVLPVLITVTLWLARKWALNTR